MSADPNISPCTAPLDIPAGAPARNALLIKAKGGLGNRMLSAVTGLVYADLTGRTPVVDWRDGVYAPLGENAYPALFEAGDMASPDTFADTTDVVPAFWQGRVDLTPDHVIEEFEAGDHANARIYRKYSVDLSTLSTDERLAVFWSYLPKMARLRPHLRKDPRFQGMSSDAIFAAYLAKYFQPNARVRREVDAFVGTLPRPVLGVHIRYTDRKISLDRVTALIRRRLSKMPGAALFLATDSGLVQERISGEFERVFVTPKYLPEADERLHSTQETPFDKIREAENAMIDMWILSRCDHLIYSKNSTFSLCSALIGALGADQQDDVDRYNLGIVAKRMIQPYI